jgi:hypothetical protein
MWHLRNSAFFYFELEHFFLFETTFYLEATPPSETVSGFA